MHPARPCSTPLYTVHIATTFSTACLITKLRIADVPDRPTLQIWRSTQVYSCWQPPATTTNTTDVPPTAHVDIITNAEVPNATAPATVNHPASEAHVSATPLATTAEATTETAAQPEQEHVFLSVEVLPNKTAPSIDVSLDDYVDAGEEYVIYYSPEPDRNPAKSPSRRKTLSGTGTMPITGKG